MGELPPIDALGERPGGGEMRRASPGGGVTWTVGEVTERLAPLSTELFPARRHETAESDFDGTLSEASELDDLPSEVPPLITVVELGVDGATPSSSDSFANELKRDGTAFPPRLAVRLPNLPPRAAVIGTCSSPLCNS